MRHRDGPRNAFLPDAAATQALGAALAREFGDRAGLVVHLHGDLGAGKTTLVRGLLRELGVGGTVRSPSYTLVEPYEARGRTVLHVDLYRLSDPAELDNLGLQDFAPDRSWWLVEWPERGGGRLPPPDLRLELSYADGGRRAAIEAAPELRVRAARVLGTASGST
ncbi:MAG: tRNA (adenosine(37)-N6)-threonylcarbamoyltransferase complex ATPase subunit type 1 TsaE [Gammaproteobacteria bacterium]|nr:tRNA (adenosine(37)-N6)-threonylcarbamoyltransferase complex ATPase subunit type 1 TsaE [Gammaproteobacteria bacterium]